MKGFNSSLITGEPAITSFNNLTRRSAVAIGRGLLLLVYCWQWAVHNSEAVPATLRLRASWASSANLTVPWRAYPK
jgi:hypothetical protein